ETSKQRVRKAQSSLLLQEPLATGESQGLRRTIPEYVGRSVSPDIEGSNRPPRCKQMVYPSASAIGCKRVRDKHARKPPPAGVEPVDTTLARAKSDNRRPVAHRKATMFCRSPSLS